MEVSGRQKHGRVDLDQEGIDPCFLCHYNV